jgi:hypothetical protein
MLESLQHVEDTADDVRLAETRGTGEAAVGTAGPIGSGQRSWQGPGIKQPHAVSPIENAFNEGGQTFISADVGRVCIVTERSHRNMIGPSTESAKSSCQ